MQHTDHIRAYYLHRARSIPGGAALDQYRVEYWAVMACYNSYRTMSGGSYLTD